MSKICPIYPLARRISESACQPMALAHWGLIIVGPFPRAIGNRWWLLVGTDYFTKSVEAEPLSNIRDVATKRFIWRNFVTRFGVPHTLISDNGLQFDSKAFKRYYKELGIINRYSTLAYPRGNGHAESINKTIVLGLKKKKGWTTWKGSGWMSCHTCYGRIVPCPEG